MEQLALTITAACSVARSGGVIASLIYLLLALGSLMAAPLAFAQTAPVGAGVRLEAGIEKEEVDTDLKSALKIYQKIAADTSAPRDVRAKALLRLAGCDEKLGKQAKQIYEEIVRGNADQPAATQARKRMALIKQQEHPVTPATNKLVSWANGDASMSRFQLLIFTMIVAVSLFIMALKNWSFPDVSDGILTLLGISRARIPHAGSRRRTRPQPATVFR